VRHAWAFLAGAAGAKLSLRPSCGLPGPVWQKCAGTAAADDGLFLFLAVQLSRRGCGEVWRPFFLRPVFSFSSAVTPRLSRSVVAFPPAAVTPGFGCCYCSCLPQLLRSLTCSSLSPFQAV